MEKNYNEIDDFFKKAFEQKGSSDEGWNTPSDEVWEALSEIGRERKPIFLYWKWAAVAAVLLLFFLVRLKSSPTFLVHIIVSSMVINSSTVSEIESNCIT